MGLVRKSLPEMDVPQNQFFRCLGLHSPDFHRRERQTLQPGVIRKNSVESRNPSM
jgi:hypothetical protein